MCAMQKKWRSQAGESLAEVLVALLICVVGVVMMVAMIAASTRVVDKSTGAMHQEYALTDIDSKDATGKVTVKWGSGTEQKTRTFDVVIQKHGTAPVFYAPSGAGVQGG